MRQLTSALALALALVPPMAQPVDARGKIESACLRANRPAASRTLCGCIQDVASSMFSRSEQKRIAKFFAEPHLSQELRQSDRRSDERLWQEYKQFGQSVRSYCTQSNN